ncbi:hypothetical protein ACDX66_04875 [Peribacillus frigoritolerans]
MKKFATLLPNYWLAETPQPLGEEAWQAVGGKGADFFNPLERLSNKKLQANSLFFEFVCSLK